MIMGANRFYIRLLKDLKSEQVILDYEILQKRDPPIRPVSQCWTLTNCLE